MRLRSLSFVFCGCLAVVFLSLSVFGQTSDRERGFEYFQQQNYEKAIEHFQKAVEQQPKDKTALAYLGFSQFKLNDRSAAKATFKRWKKIKPKDSVGEKLYDQSYKILSRSRAPITEEIRNKYRGGNVKLFVELGTDKKIKAVYLLDDNIREWHPILFAVASAIQFEPATKAGKPVSTIAMIEYSFSVY